MDDDPIVSAITAADTSPTVTWAEHRRLVSLLSSRESIRQLCFQTGMALLLARGQVLGLGLGGDEHTRAWAHDLADALEMMAVQLSDLRDLFDTEA